MGRWLQAQEGELVILRKATRNLRRQHCNGSLGAITVEIYL